ncbi:hypothetical protein [Asticcacaulis machinosus]|uniref:Uncharacterized protein n=1 Tax=Asticcacaulis machinosus TaxID=2984211 RepID=A0ABT5HKA4_9CAUL|nr:hypothetical protein [Asticcacaulis machinosus]MDC7676571.1 hypothetical protein [Asticcacaulis machinosus]
MSGDNWIWWFWVSGSSVVAAACGIIAWWRGGVPERYGFTLILIGWTLTPFVQDRGGHGPGVWVMLLDIITFIGLIVISVWSRRIWTLFACAFMLDTVASHLVVFLAPHVDLYSYITSLGFGAAMRSRSPWSQGSGKTKYTGKPVPTLPKRLIRNYSLVFGKV